MKNLIVIKFFIILFIFILSEHVIPNTTDDKKHKNKFSLANKILDQDYAVIEEGAMQIDCLTGITLFGWEGIQYEVFPKIGIFRVKKVGMQPDNKWIIFEDPEIYDIGEDTKELPEELRKKILYVGSGLRGVDLTRAIVTCGRNTDYFKVLVRKNNDNEEQDKEKFTVIIDNKSEDDWLIKKDNFWQSLEVASSKD